MEFRDCPKCRGRGKIPPDVPLSDMPTWFLNCMGILFGGFALWFLYMLVKFFIFVLFFMEV